MHSRYFILIFFLFIKLPVCLAAPPSNVKGNLVFLGVNHDSSQSVWLSLTTAGSFRLEGPGQQLIDEWSEARNGLRLSLSPVVSQGNGGTHHLINSENNKKLDSENQQDGILFPPLPIWPPPGVPTHPIVIPPQSSGIPTHPIVIPPESPGVPTHPIVIPPESSGIPTHPIVIPPESSGIPTHPIVIPPELPPQISQPNPPGSAGLSQGQSSLQNMTPNYFNQSAPITRARQIDEQPWNIWSDNYYFGIQDTRENVDTKAGATNFVVGADRHLTNKLVGGFSLASVHLDSEAYNFGLENNVSGFKVGPYFGYQLSPKWTTDGSIYYGQFQNKNTILSLNSQYVTQTINATLHATGLYQLGNFQLRPQPLFSYTYFQNPTYDFNGSLGNNPIQVTREKENFVLSYAEFKLEGNYTTQAKNGDMIQPYTEIGADYSFIRPADDQVYSGNLALASLPRASGLFTLGIRALHARKLLIELSSSYLSLGQSGYDLWDARLLLSYSFS